MATKHRGSARQRGYSWRWEKLAKLHRAREPLCRMCKAKGIVRAAELVDHILPHKGDQRLFWDESNWQSLCHECHNIAKQRAERIGYSTDIGRDGWPMDPHHPANQER